MAGSRKSSRAEPAGAGPVTDAALQLGRFVGAGDRLVVGLSGGIDSVVLLDLLAGLAPRRKFSLAAIHVNHQLSPHAARWTAFCRRFCRRLGIRLRTVKVVVPRGDSVEAAARRVRYREFMRLRADFIVLAHNQDDQAETLLLQLLRGAGVKGAAAMPVLRREERSEWGEGRGAKSRSGPSILRPLLGVPRSEIERYARSRGLEWVVDQSNADNQYARNYLRHEVLPLIAARYPAYRATLSRAARHFADTSELIDELAAIDAAGAPPGGALAVATLRGLSRARAGNLLRWFIARHGVVMPNAERLAEALRQVLGSKADARVCIDLGDHELRRFAGAAYVVRKAVPPPAGFVRTWRGERALKLPELGGELHMMSGHGTGLSLARLLDGTVTVRLRAGGEHLRPDPARSRRSLKNLLQEARIPPWQRERLPLLYCGTRLAWVAGIGADAAFLARKGERSVLPEWRPA